MHVAFREVSRTFTTRSGKVRALRRVSWELPVGCTCLIGPNGGGKSTLMNIATTLLAPDEGEVLLDGEPVRGRRRDEYRARIGLVPQHISFPTAMTCRDVLEYMGWLNRMPAAGRRRRAEELMARFSLTGKSNDKAGALSGGQLRRLGIAAALVHDPAVLFLDEPTVGLDPEMRLGVRSAVAELASERTVLISTHLLEDVRHLPGSLAVLADGRLIYTGNWRDLESRMPVSERELGSGFEFAYAGMVTELTSADAADRGGAR